MNKFPVSPPAMRHYRLQSGLSIQDAARLIGINKMTLLRYESGDIKTASIERLTQAALVYHVPALRLTGQVPADGYQLSCPPFLTVEVNLPPSYFGIRLLSFLKNVPDFSGIKSV